MGDPLLKFRTVFSLLLHLATCYCSRVMNALCKIFVGSAAAFSAVLSYNLHLALLTLYQVTNNFIAKPPDPPAELFCYAYTL